LGAILFGAGGAIELGLVHLYSQTVINYLLAIVRGFGTQVLHH